MKKLITGLAVAAIACAAAGLAACTTPKPEEPPHEHAYSDEWKKDEGGHWKVCTSCNEATQKTAHRNDEGVVDPDPSCTQEGVKTFTCLDCGFITTECVDKTAHDFHTAYKYDTTEHWRKCAYCDTTDGREAHYGGEATKTERAKCEACKQPYGEVNPTAVQKIYFTETSGSFEQKTASSVQSSLGNSIAVVKDDSFVYGTLKAKINMNGAGGDNGIIFGVTNPDRVSSFWENDVQYYFFFLSSRGSAYLGSVNDGAWTLCREVYLSSYDNTKTYELKAERSEQSVKCYVDGALVFEHFEAFPFAGTGYGLRAGAVGVTYSALSADSHGEITAPTDGVMRTVTGSVHGTPTAVQTKENETLALFDKTLASGTLSMYASAKTNGNTGVVFGYCESGYYLFYINRRAQRMELAQIAGGQKTVLAHNYLSAGYHEGSSFPIRVVLKEGKAYCYFFNTLYFVESVTLSGNEIGVYAETSGAQFFAFDISADTTVSTCDTLIFGHSYTEMWDDWRTDTATINGLGKAENCGIGGSIAEHWLGFKESLVAYRPAKGIYWIGINDLTNGMSPYLVCETIRDTLLYVKENIPEFSAVLLSTNYCNARENIRSEIVALNALVKDLCAEYDWISYAEMLNAFSDENERPLASWFKDGLHPTAAGYREKVIPAIVKALNGEDQPDKNDALQAKILERAKSIKKCEIADYCIDGFRDEEWEEAEPIYSAALAAIEACTSKDEVLALDLSSYLTQLKAIKHNGDYVFDEMMTTKYCSAWETDKFRDLLNTSADGGYKLTDAGHRINNAVRYTDLGFTFSLTENTGEIGTAGVLFRATQTGSLGVNGYFINIVTEPNYIQVWYFEEGYGTGNAKVFEYLGGWVFPDEVENTLFRAVVKGDMVYIYTEETYLAKGEQAYGCSVSLTGGGRFPLYRSGGIGVLAWDNGEASCKLTVESVVGAECHSTPEQRLAKAKEKKIALLERYDSLAYRAAEWESAQVIYNAAVASINNCETIETVETFDLTEILAELAAIKTNTRYTFEEMKENTNTIHYETPLFAQTLAASTDGKYSVAEFGHRILNTVQYGDLTFTFRMSELSGNVGQSGILFRAKQNILGGVNGYLLNFVSNDTQQYLQILHLNNAYAQFGESGPANYLGGWVFPAKVADTLFRAVVKGDTIFLYIETDWLEMGELANGVSVPLAFNGSAYPSGGIGILNWENTSKKIEINNLRSASCKTLSIATDTAVDGITSGENRTAKAPENVSKTAGGGITVGNVSFSVFDGFNEDNFNFTVKLSDINADAANIGVLFRAKKNPTGTGVDGYLFAFNNEFGNQFIQVYYLQNFLCDEGDPVPVICEYIDGWIYTDTYPGGSVIDTTLHVSVGDNFVCYGRENNVRPCDLTGGGRFTPYAAGGIGVLSNKPGLTGTVTIKNLFVW